VIIITGVGRSGTSLVARIYAELGLDPGGSWNPEINAGFEDPEVVRINRAIMIDLGVGLALDLDLAEHRLVRLDDGGLEARDIARPGEGFLDRPAVKLPTRVVPGPLRRAVRGRGERAAQAVRRRLRGGLGRRGATRQVDWKAFDAVVERHGETLRELATARALVKDPRFAWTLGVWAAAGAPVEHVVLCVRDIEASVDSRIAAGHIPPDRRAEASAMLSYGLDLCLTTLRKHGLEHAEVRFPEFLEAPDELFAAMRLPESVTRERFDEAFARVTDPSLVHHEAR
jgi:hypothetical protein